MKTVIKGELWVNHKLEKGGRKFFHLWINAPKAGGLVVLRTFVDTCWAKDKADAIEIARARFGIDGEYKALEGI